MPLYYFDIADGGAKRDDTGTECADDESVRMAARRALPDIAKEEIPQDGDRRFFTVVVRNEAERTIYTATLAFAGVWLRDRPPVGA